MWVVEGGEGSCRKGRSEERGNKGGAERGKEDVEPIILHFF